MSEQYRSKQTYPFMMIPHKIWEIGLTGNEIAVFLRIFYRAGFEHECFESRTSIAEACCLSEKTVSNCFAELERLNILQITRRRVENKPNLITINHCDEWLSKRKNFPSEDRPQVKSTPDLEKNLPEAREKITYGTRVPELDSIEQDSFLKDIASDPVAAPEVIESEVVFDGVPQQMASRKEVQTTSMTTSMTSTTKDSLSPTMNAWRGYSEAFYAKYKVEPQRNARVMGQLKKFVEFVGSADAPEILRFYLTCNDQWYVKNMHSVGIALSQAEKLAAGYRGARVFTTKEAQQIDSMQTSQNIVDDFYNNLEAHGYAQEGNS